MAGPLAYQQQFQNAGQNGNFEYSYNNVGNNAWVFPVLILAFVILVAFLRSEARYRKLLEQIAFGEGGYRPRPMHAPRKMAHLRQPL